MKFIKKNSVITLFNSIHGGRINSISEEYSPNVVFGANLKLLQNYWDNQRFLFDEADNNFRKNCGIRFEIGGEIHPGDIGKAEFKISERSFNYIGEELLKSNVKFFIREGNNIIGTGIIL